MLRESGNDIEKWKELWQYTRFTLPVKFGVASVALANRYPKLGLTGWHTNSNSSGYQFLFTWSENGKGVFKYKDIKTGEIVSIQDKPGWQCRWYHFTENEPYCWHCCYTECERLTIAFKIDKISETVQQLRDDFIFEIEQKN